MNIFSKKESVVSNITFMALMAAINVIFVLLSTFIPVLMVMLVLVLPFVSAITTLLCNKKYLIIYIVATITLCMLATMWNISDTLFYIIPSIVSGIVFALLIEKGIPSIYTIILGAACYFILTYISLPIIKAIYGIDVINSLLISFGLNDLIYSNYIVSSFILFLAITQSAISYYFITTQSPKIGINKALEISNKYYFIIPLCSLISILLFVLFALVLPEYCYIFLAICGYFSIYLLFDTLLYNKIYIYICFGVSLILFVIIFGICYSLIPNPFGLSLIFVLFILINIIALLNKYLLNKKDNIK